MPIALLNVRMELISPLKACSIAEDDLTKVILERYANQVACPIARSSACRRCSEYYEIHCCRYVYACTCLILMPA